MFGKKKHNHEWHEVLEKDVTGLFNIKKTIHVVFCPICDKRRELESEEWNIIKNEQKIKHEFNLKEDSKCMTLNNSNT